MYVNIYRRCLIKHTVPTENLPCERVNKLTANLEEDPYVSLSDCEIISIVISQNYDMDTDIIDRFI